MSLENTKTLLKTVRERGIHLFTEDGKLKFKAAKGALTTELKQQITAHKQELIQELQASRQEQSIQPAPSMENYPLSYAQFRLWAMQQMEGATSAYHIRLPLLVNGPLDRDALSWALDYLVERHESLRTNFISNSDGEPRQVIRPADRNRLTYEDCSGQRPEDAGLKRRIKAFTTQPFNLEKDPLFRAHLIKRSGEEHLLIVVMHHIISDGWSLSVLAREWQQSYEQILDRQPARLSDPGIQYKDYAVWQQQQTGLPEFEDQRSWWLKRLEQPPVVELPTDFQRPAMQSYKGETRFFRLGKEQSKAVKELGRQQQCTLFMILSSFVFILLNKYTGQEDLILGTPVSGRSHPDLSGQIGFYLNMVALRSGLQPDQVYTDYLQQLKSEILESFDRQEYPFDHLIGELELPRDLSRTPLLDVMIFMQNAGSLNMKLGEATVEGLLTDSGDSKTDLVFDFSDEPDGISFSINYATDLFSSSTIDRMAQHLTRIVESVTDGPEKSISDIAYLTGQDRQLIRSVNETLQPVSNDDHLVTSFLSQADATPDQTAVSDTSGERLTYRELNEKSLRLARYLASQGTGPGDIIAVGINPRVELAVTLLAIARTGAGWFALDTTFPAERITYMLEDAGCKWILTHSDTGPIPGVELNRFNTCLVDRLPAAEQYGADSLPEPVPDQLAYTIYTSGSTGRPKGVLIEHHSLINFLFAMKDLLKTEPGASMPLLTTISFDISYMELFLPLISGGSVHILNRSATRDGFALAQELSETSYSHIQATPATWRMLIEAGWTGDDGLTAISGGEALTPNLADELLKRSNKLWNLYGPTETTIWSSAHPVEPAKDSDQQEYVSIGRPIRNTEIYLLDRQKKLVAPGISGELWIGGAGLARQYHNRPELTEERFQSIEIESGTKKRLYRTGDMVRMNRDGSLDYLGRSDHQVKIRGFRIEPGEIESRLLELPGVTAAAVLAVRNSQKEYELHAYWTGEGEKQELLRKLRESLPDYMIPLRWVPLQEMPMTLNKKIDRTVLAQLTDSSYGEQEHENQEPVTETERKLADMWKELLDVQSVGRASRFFQMGGHSLKAMRLVNLIRSEFSIHLETIEIFKHPELMEMSGLIDRKLQEVPERKKDQTKNALSEAELATLMNFGNKE